ncbi:MAG: hypothetical protein HY534_03875 [Chloroflexi bacterium]|nr:hypothetical protein [Chloroflexota bacterium]
METRASYFKDGFVGLLFVVLFLASGGALLWAAVGLEEHASYRVWLAMRDPFGAAVNEILPRTVQQVLAGLVGLMFVLAAPLTLLYAFSEFWAALFPARRNPVPVRRAARAAVGRARRRRVPGAAPPEARG